MENCIYHLNNRISSNHFMEIHLYGRRSNQNSKKKRGGGSEEDFVYFEKRGVLWFKQEDYFR